MTPSRAFRSVAAVALAITLSPLPSSIAAQTVQGQRYVLRMTTGGDRELIATVREGGGRARIDFERSEDGASGYLIVSDGARTVTLVHPDKREYSVVDDTTFERIIGKALRVVAQIGVLQVQLRDVRIQGERLGAGETIAGYATRHYRITQDYRAYVGAFGIVGDEPIHQVVVSEYWVSPGLPLTRNPLLELLAGVETALAQRNTSFVTRSAATRDSLFRGTPLRVVVTARASRGDDTVKERRIEITDVAQVPLDASIWAIPSGYTRRQSDFSFDIL